MEWRTGFLTRARATRVTDPGAVAGEEAAHHNGAAAALESGAVPPKRFTALIAASSIFVVALAVAGFSLRWSYYYNFGLQNIISDAPLSSLAVSAVEILRTPESIYDLILLALVVLIPFQLLLGLVRWLSHSPHRAIRRAADIAATFLGLNNALFTDVILAGLVVFVAFRAGAIAGSRDYLNNVDESKSRLPRVTAIASIGEEGGKAAALPINCDTRPLLERTPTAAPAFIGDAQTVTRLKGAIACSSETRSWRLLHRDEKFVYLFLTVSGPGKNPETLIIPNSDRLTLVLQ